MGTLKTSSGLSADDSHGITTGELEKLMVEFYGLKGTAAAVKFKFRMQQLSKLNIPSRIGLAYRQRPRHGILGLIEFIIAFDALNMGFTGQMASDIALTTVYRMCNSPVFSKPSEFFHDQGAQIIIQPTLLLTRSDGPVFESDNSDVEIWLVPGGQELPMMLDIVGVAYAVFPIGRRVAKLKKIGETTRIIPGSRYDSLTRGA